MFAQVCRAQELASKRGMDGLKSSAVDIRRRRRWQSKSQIFGFTVPTARSAALLAPNRKSRVQILKICSHPPERRGNCTECEPAVVNNIAPRTLAHLPSK